MNSQELKARLEEIWRRGPLCSSLRRTAWTIAIGEPSPFHPGQPVSYTSKETRRRRRGLAMYNPSLHEKVRAQAKIIPWWVVWPDQLRYLAQVAGGLRDDYYGRAFDRGYITADEYNYGVYKLTEAGWAALAEASKHLNGEDENVAAE